MAELDGFIACKGKVTVFAFSRLTGSRGGNSGVASITLIGRMTVECSTEFDLTPAHTHTHTRLIQSTGALFIVVCTICSFNLHQTNLINTSTSTSHTTPAHCAVLRYDLGGHWFTKRKAVKSGVSTLPCRRNNQHADESIKTLSGCFWLFLKAVLLAGVSGKLPADTTTDGHTKAGLPPSLTASII